MNATGPPSRFAHRTRRRRPVESRCNWRVGVCCALVAITAIYCATASRSILLSSRDAEHQLLRTQLPEAGSSTPAPRRLAFAIQGNASDIPTVRNILAHMEMRSQVDVFYLAWVGGKQQAGLESWSPSEGDPLVQVIFDTSASWTAGRNKLARAVFAEEARRKAPYCAWGFVDVDAFMVNCIGCPQAAPGNSSNHIAIASACCLDYVVRDVVLANHTGFATYSNTMSQPLYKFVKSYESDVEFLTPRVLLNQDCSDAQLQIFDRDAVPVLLPYHTDLDTISWWSSQAIFFYVSMGCLKGANAILSRQLRPIDNFHISYPRGRNETYERRVVAFHYPELMSFPFNQDICTEQDAPEDFVVEDLREGRPSKDWRTSEAFLACLRVREPRFRQDMDVS